MKNRKLILILSLVLALTMSLGGTLAYLTDMDSEVNTMVLGNVDIEQHEYQRATKEDGTYKTDTIDNRTSYVLEAFEDDKPLLPAIIPNGGTVGGVKWNYDSIPVRMSQVGSHGGAQVFNTANAVDKFVTVENTGKTDAYVRTFIAFEVGNATLDNATYPNQPLISSEIRAAEAKDNTNGQFPWTYGFSGYVEIKGNNYLVYELLYTGAMTSNGWKHENGILPAGETTYPSLCQVYMASWANNQEVIDLDGNANDKYDILVLSQAIQVNGWTKVGEKSAAQFALDTGFGEATAENVKAWFEGNDEIEAEMPKVNIVNVSTADELVNAFANIQAGDTIVLNSDIDMTGKTLLATTGNKGFTLKGRGFTISNLKSTQNGLFVNNTGSADYYFYDVNLKNCTVESAKNYAGLFVGDADTCDELVIEGCTVTDCTVKSAKYAAAFVAYTAGYNVQNNGPVYSDVTIKDCKVIGGSITGGGSTAAAVGHSGGNVDTTTTITNLTVRGVAINGEDAAHTGIVVGTAHVGKTIIDNVTYSGVTGNYNTETILYGRNVPGESGELIIDGVKK